MNRCAKFLQTALALALCTSLTALAQVRDFPSSALRGTLVVTQPPFVQMDGQADKLSPGARLHDVRNLLLMSGTVLNQPLVVNYTRDPYGLINEVWLLTADEAALERKSGSAASNLVIIGPNGSAVGISVR
jgi:hypothetical protein